MTSKTPKQLKKLRGKIVYFERQYARMKNQERKEDTRRKIQLGGLVKKAGLENESTAVLFGLLLEAAEKLQATNSDHVRTGWKIKGDLVFTNEQNDILD